MRYLKSLLNTKYAIQVNDDVEPNHGVINEFSKLEMKSASDKMKKNRSLWREDSTYRCLY